MHARVCLDAAPSNAPTVVMVHGLGVSSRYLLPTVYRLAPFCRVYAVDLPGFGESDKPTQALNVDELSDALVCWMSEVKLHQAAFIANSFGCQIVVNTAVRHPSRITRAVLTAPTVDAQARSAVQQIARLVLNIPREPMSLIPLVTGDYLNAGLGRAIRTLRYALADPVEAKLPAVRVPTLVVRGEHDPMVPQQWAEAVARLLPEAQLIVIPGAGHAVNYNSPDQLARIVLPFLASEIKLYADSPAKPGSC